jgi:PKD repeat protein
MIQVRALAVTCAAILSASCIDNQKAPALSGPSGFGQSLTMTASPDTLPRDGAAQSQVVINFHDAGADEPLAGRTLILGSTAGTLSTGQVVTDAAGNASVVLIAPDMNSGATEARVSATAVGTNASNGRTHSIVIRLIGPAPPEPAFTYTPEMPTAGVQVLFDASPTTFGQGTTAAEYRWNFGDGTPEDVGKQATHIFGAAGSYPVSLTVTDSLGRVVGKVEAVQVGGAATTSK